MWCSGNHSLLFKQKVQKDKQRSTKHTYITKDQVTRTPLKTGGEFRCSGRVSSSCSTSDNRRVNLVTNPVISYEWGKDRVVLWQVEHIRCHLFRTKLYDKSYDLNFPIVNFHLYVATFQQHLHMEYISLSWYDIPECRFYHEYQI
jgi:hypothetical protein